MLEQDIFSHTGINGTSAHDRIVASGFDLQGSWATGENIAVGSVGGAAGYYDEIDRLFEGLMNSPGHRANILSPNFDYVGIGIEVGAFDFSQGTYTSVMITQNFGGTDGTPVLDTGTAPADPAPEPETPAALELTGTDGNDTLTGQGGTDTLMGEEGDDTLIGNGGDDVVYGGTGDDELRGNQGDDELRGNAGNDIMYGGDGNDLLVGNTGDDIMYGGSGVNKLVGQRGEDTLIGGDERDILNGGGDADTLHGNGGNDRLKGGTRSDTLYGGEGPDVLYGNRHDDFLYGQEGDDYLNGGGEDDWLDGGTGDDRMKGGSGADSFVFETGFDSDRVLDFDLANDQLLIDSSYWGTNETAAELLDDHASVTSAGVVIDFGGGDVITLEGLTTTDGLEDVLVTV